jgi:hypothetical protein
MRGNGSDGGNGDSAYSLLPLYSLLTGRHPHRIVSAKGLRWIGSHPPFFEGAAVNANPPFDHRLGQVDFLAGRLRREGETYPKGSVSGGASRPAEYVALEAYTYVLVCGHDSQPLVAPFEDVTSCIEKARRFSSS